MSVPLQEKIGTLAELVSKPKVLSGLLSLYHSGYLKETGWLPSFEYLSPQDSSGNPIPWMTLPFIDFLESRNLSDLTIFEYGSGSSSFYFAKRCKQVTSGEHNPEWYQSYHGKLPANCELLFTPLTKDSAYARSAAITGKKYDIIIVDAEDRVNCVQHSFECLSSGGVLVLDDSERPEYREAFTFMEAKGYRKIDFTGMAPGVLFKKCTTIFYTQENLLRI